MRACNEVFTYATKKLCKKCLIFISQRLNNLIWIRTTVLSLIIYKCNRRVVHASHSFNYSTCGSKIRSSDRDGI